MRKDEALMAAAEAAAAKIDRIMKAAEADVGEAAEDTA